MPTTRYLLAGAVDLNAAASYSPATAPAGWASGDTLIINDGTADVQTNLTALAATTLALVMVTDTFKGRLGNSGTPMKFGTVTKFEVSTPGGQHYFEFGTACTKFKVNGTQGGKIWVLGAGGTITEFSNFFGESEIGGSVTATGIKAFNGRVILRSGSGSNPTTVEVFDGKVESYRTIVTASTLRPDAELTLLQAAAVSTLLRSNMGWVKKWSTGTLTKLEGFGGKMTHEQCPAPYTITNADLGQSFAIDQRGPALITYTNPPEYYTYAVLAPEALV